MIHSNNISYLCTDEGIIWLCLKNQGSAFAGRVLVCSDYVIGLWIFLVLNKVDLARMHIPFSLTKSLYASCKALLDKLSLILYVHVLGKKSLKWNFSLNS